MKKEEPATSSLLRTAIVCLAGVIVAMVGVSAAIYLFVSNRSNEPHYNGVTIEGDYIDMRGTGVTTEAVHALDGRRPTHVDANGSRMSVDALIPRLPTSIRELTLSNMPVTAADLAKLNVPELHLLNLENCSLGDEVWDELARFPELKKLNLAGNPIRFKVNPSHPVPALTALSLARTQMDGGDLRDLIAAIPSLKNVSLNETKIADCAQIDPKSQLVYCEVSRTDISTECMASIIALPHVEYVGAQACPKVDWKRIAHTVPNRNLRVLDLQVTNVDEETRNAFRNKGWELVKIAF